MCASGHQFADVAWYPVGYISCLTKGESGVIVALYQYQGDVLRGYFSIETISWLADVAAQQESDCWNVSEAETSNAARENGNLFL